MTTNNTVTATATAEATSFEFRSKFQKLLNDENRSAIVEGFQNFCRLRPDAARKLLWNLTYRRDLTISFERLGMKPELIAAEDLSLFRNELRHQYQKRRQDFLEVNVPDSCQEAFNKLAGSSDTITAVVVHERIVNRLFLSASLGNPSKILFLLGCDTENMYCGGLADIGFSNAEIAYLKPLYKNICELFGALYEHHLPNIPAPTSNQPFAGLAKRLEEAGFQYSPVSKLVDTGATPAEATAQASGNAMQQESQDDPQHVEASGEAPASATISVICKAESSTSLTAQNILEHKEPISSLVFSKETMALLQQLRACGLDLNEIVEKEVKIKALLKSVNDLSA